MNPRVRSGGKVKLVFKRIMQWFFRDHHYVLRNSRNETMKRLLNAKT